MGAVRACLADHTRAVHEALHHDPVLSRLAQPGVPEADYRDALTAFSAFYRAVERVREEVQLWPQFSLHAECAALEQDIGPRDAARMDRRLFTGPARHAAVLGALYVAHGAGFGRASMRANVLCALPHLPHHFLRLPTSPTRWRALVAALEATSAEASDLAAARSGAALAFATMRDAAVAVRVSTAAA
jgi:heme oxygenase